MMDRELVFVRRRSPDWSALADDHLAGRFIDPSRFVPDHPIPGFPPRVDRLVARWNALFQLDFFSFRHAVAELSAASVAAVPNARRLGLGDLPTVAALARKRPVLVYFHDDDDFFSPGLAEQIGEMTDGVDAVVTPLFRLGQETYTFVSDGVEADLLWGPPERFRFRYHTNNYGLTSRPCRDEALLRSLVDHVEASEVADRVGLVDAVLASPVSATVKTPASASALQALVDRPSPRDDLLRFVAGVRAIPAPPGSSWIAGPLADIACLVAAAAGQPSPLSAESRRLGGQ